LRLTAQEQSIKPVLSEAEGAEKAFEVTTNCTNFVHKTNYTRKETFYKCFFEDF